MILDALLQFSGTLNPTAGQLLNKAAGTYTSDNVIDTAGVGLFSQARDLGKGRDLNVMIEVTQAFAGGTSLTVNLVEADDAAISVNVQTLTSTPVIPLASLTLGQQIPLHWDRVEPFAQRRYIAVTYTIVGTMTAGAVVTFVVDTVQDKGNNTIFNSGFSVS